MINFHPTTEQLKAFAAGNLPAAEALVISAHCDMCEKCQKLVRAYSKQFAQEAFAEASLDPKLESMMADIMQQPIAERPQLSIPAQDSIELDGRSFRVPRALRRYVKQTGNWSSLVGKLWQAPVDMGEIGVANFIYMEKGGRVPEHTHKGSEFTLVINGEFSDGIANYDSGDFIALDGEHTHAPMSEADEGCLVFSIVEKPLHFTSGIARLLNPFSHLFFK